MKKQEKVKGKKYKKKNKIWQKIKKNEKLIRSRRKIKIKIWKMKKKINQGQAKM